MSHLFKNPTFDGLSEEQGQEVSEMLEKELAKPYKKRDYDKIEELLNEYTRMNGMEEQIQKASETGVQKVIARTKTRKLRVRKYRPLITVVCLAVVMAIFNTISVVAFDMNAFSFIVPAYFVFFWKESNKSLMSNADFEEEFEKSEARASLFLAIISLPFSFALSTAPLFVSSEIASSTAGESIPSALAFWKREVSFSMS